MGGGQGLSSRVRQEDWQQQKFERGPELLQELPGEKAGKGVSAERTARDQSRVSLGTVDTWNGRVLCRQEYLAHCRFLAAIPGFYS